MIELSIPQLNEESKNVKDLVVTLLSREQPLSIIELVNKIRKEYVLSVTYQAVRKAVNGLERQKILEKEAKTYRINKQWVLQTKSFFDKLLTTYETKVPLKLFNVEMAKEDYAIYTFTNLLDLDFFWGDVQSYWIDHEKENKEFFSYCYYPWWLLINLGQETKIFDYFKTKRIKSTIILASNTPLSRWAAGIYKELEVGIKILSKKAEGPLVDLNILGDTVIQVRYPEKLAQKIKILFEKSKNLQDISLKEITKLAHEQAEIKFVLFKNPSIAKSLRETYNK